MHDNLIWLWISIVVLAILGILIYFSRVRRSLLRLRINLDKTWAAIDALLKQRHDEIPKLLGTCRGYMPLDHPAFEPVTRARTDYVNARTMQEKMLANIAMEGAIEELFKIADSFPGLKSNNNFMKFRKHNAELETNINEQQELFNELVQTYNRRIRSFPNSLVASRAHLQLRERIPVPDLDNVA